MALLAMDGFDLYKVGDVGPYTTANNVEFDPTGGNFGGGGAIKAFEFDGRFFKSVPSVSNGRIFFGTFVFQDANVGGGNQQQLFELGDTNLSSVDGSKSSGAIVAFSDNGNGDVFFEIGRAHV